MGMTRTNRQKRIRKQRKEQTKPREGCPHPLKRAYPDDRAIKAALNRSRSTGRPMRIYTCQCGALHLTKQKRRKQK